MFLNEWKKKSVVTTRLEPTPPKMWSLIVLSPPLYQLNYNSAEGEGLFQIYKIYNFKREGVYMIYNMYWYVNAMIYNLLQ